MTGAPAAATTGPLRPDPANPRYLVDAGGRAVYLTGSHTWDSLQDMGESDPPEPFDFGAYLDFLEGHGHNFVRLWRWELLTWDTAANGQSQPRRIVAAPHPWERTGPGRAADGRPRFDLDRFDEAYFRRLRSRVAAARERGLYVSVMLFEGWGLRFVRDGWRAHPFHPANNVNGLEGEPIGRGTDLFTLASPRVTALQEAYVRKVVDTVHDLDNVLYEIANESDFSSTDWQYHLIRFTRQVESTCRAQHPVGMTSIGFGVDDLDRLLASPADWISPNPDRRPYKDDPPPAADAKVILLDTDHLWGIGGSVSWVWKSFARGLNPIFMDPYRRRVLDRGPEEEWEEVRRSLGVARRLADRLPLAAMAPRPDLASTACCLADPGRHWVVYLPEGGPVTVDLAAAGTRPLSVQWLDPRTGAAADGGTIAGGAQAHLQPPVPGDSVLHLWAP